MPPKAPTGAGETLKGHTMPLPNVKRFCHATCKATGKMCLNPAAFGMPVCRYHGAKKPQSIRHGAAHGRYKTGEFTQVSKLAYRQGADRILEIEEVAFNAGLLRTRMAGRKPKAG